MKHIKKKIKNVLISIYNKTNIIPLAKILLQNNINIFTTKNTQIFLHKNNIYSTNISKITNYPEMLNGQIKTIHPKIFAGILGTNNDIENIKQKNIVIFDLIIVNFYQFNNQDYHQDLEKFIDIGGPAIVRAAAKNYKNTTIITDIADYNNILNQINKFGYINIETKLKLAQKAFEYTNNYDFKIFKYFEKKINLHKKKFFSFPKTLYMKYKKVKNLKYGENPNQKAALYIREKYKKMGSIDSIKKINGSKLSYNNINDAHIAFECVNQFQKPACVIVKHGNPCGAAISDNITTAYFSAYKSDPTSAFGGIIGFNKLINTKTIIEIIKNQFVEIIIGPEITKSAQSILIKYPKIKVLICGYYINSNIIKEIKTINHSLLIQESNLNLEKSNNWIVVSKKKPTDIEKKYALFCWNIAKFVKSNAIVYSYKFNIIGIGSGQTNRLQSVQIANMQYKKNEKIFSLKNKNIVMASDAFFPFRDGIDESMKNKKISCIIQPGGSIKDLEIIQAVNDHNSCMIFTNNRTFKH